MAKKKNQKASSDGGGGVTTTDFAAGDMKSLMKEHSLFFDTLVELIPAKFYLPANDKDKVYFQGLTASEKVEAKQKTIENTKKARRNRLDPTNSSKTTLVLLKESIENEKLDADAVELGDGGADDDDAETTTMKVDKSSGAVTYEELQQRLWRKLEALKAERGGGGGSRSEDGDAYMGKRKQREFDRKEDWMKREKEIEEEKKKAEREKEIEKEIAEAAEGIKFGKMKLDNDEDGDDRKKRKKRKLSKEKELEIARQLQEAKKDPEMGELVATKHSWKAAEERAMGVKVHDNPRMLKESMQREKRKHKKSVEKWKDRVNTTEAKKKEKQDKRKGNIQDKKKQKKMKKIEKREKKLMNRPGFEGRKDGFINGEK